MDCSAHPGTAATSTCGVCMKAACERCLDFDVDGATACHACGTAENDRSRALGSAQLVLVGVAYLITLAVGFVVFRARPFVGGLAAVVAIAVGRVLQTYLRPPLVTPRAAR